MLGKQAVRHSFPKERDSRLNTHFQMVRTHAVTQSFSFCWYTSVNTLKFNWSENMRLNVFKKSGNKRIYNRFQMVELHPVTLSFSNCRNIMLHIHTRFKMVSWHPVTYLFSNGWEIFGYMLVYKFPGHTQLHTRFQMVVPHPVSQSIWNDRDTPC